MARAAKVALDFVLSAQEGTMPAAKQNGAAAEVSRLEFSDWLVSLGLGLSASQEAEGECQHCENDRDPEQELGAG
jgi:hypothetical protein